MRLELDNKLVLNKEVAEAPNLIERFTEQDRAKIGALVDQGYRRDLQSRAKWYRRMETAMDLAMQIQKEKSFPWPGAANVNFPLVTIAALQFSARSYTNIIQGTDVVRYRTVGLNITKDQCERADRISNHMSWQVLEQDMPWEEQHDRLLINLAVMGSSFIKTFHSSKLNHDVSELVMARDFVLDYHAKSIEECARKSHIITLYRNEVYERCAGETFLDVRDSDWFNSLPSAPITESTGPDNRQGKEPVEPDSDAPFRFVEQHRLLDLDKDGYEEPYIVTMEEGTKNVVRLVARWDREEAVSRSATKRIQRIEPTEYFTKFSFIPAPDGGVYDLGFGALLGPINESVNTGINQLLDAGTMSNAGGGFLGRGSKIRGGVYTRAPWEWKRVDSTGDDLRKNMIPHAPNEPSTVLFSLISLLINYTDRVAGTTEVMTGGNPGQNTKATTSNNTIEQGMQVYNMIFKRVWRSMKEEFKKRHRLNAIYLPNRFVFGDPDDKGNRPYILREDYKSNSNFVVPSADPNVTSKTMKIQKAMTVAQRAMQVPGYDIAEVERAVLKALEVEYADRLYPGPDKVPAPKDPKITLAEMKLQGQALQMKTDNQQFALKLMEERKMNMAKMLLIHAQIAKLEHDAGMDISGHQLEALNSVLSTLESHNQLVNERIAALTAGGSDEDSSGGAGVQPMAPGPSDGGGVSPDGEVAGGAEGAMGGGDVSGG